MLDMDLPERNVQVTHDLWEWLARQGDKTPEAAGRLSADLGDIYAGAIHYQRLIEALLGTSTVDRETLGELLSDLYEEMRHLGAHLESSLDDVDALAERFD